MSFRRLQKECIFRAVKRLRKFLDEAIMIDLHIHSFYSSDGEFSPAQLIKKCAKNNISLMSITDHNTVRAYKEASDAAAKSGIEYIPGIEIDFVYNGTNFHMLGYGIDCTSPDFWEIENNIRSQGLNVSYEMLEKTKKLGFDITESDMRSAAAGSHWPEIWTGEQFAEIILSRSEYKDSPLLRPYRPDGARGDNPYVNFYWDFYSQGKPCYAEIYYPPMQEVIDIIRQNHGKAILAHPCVNLKGCLPDDIIKLGIDGIEAFSSYHSPSQAVNIMGYIKNYGLIATCGSDFHGKTKPSISLAQHGCLLSEDEMRSFCRRI